MSGTLVLIDLSSIAHQIWHTCQGDPDVNACSRQIIARVHALAANQPNVVICCDSGKTFRNDIAPTYKANRPEHDASLRHQITVAREQIGRDGFPVWSVKGFEADDIIATATVKAVTETDYKVLIVTADKDMYQLVDEHVQIKSVRDGSLIDTEGVRAKFGVYPGQIRDYLCLVGDSADNVKGAKGIGPKRAAELLTRFGSLEGIYQALASPASNGFTPALATSLREFSTVRQLTEELISLRADVEIPFAEAFVERVAQASSTFTEQDGFGMDEQDEQPEQDQPTAAPPAATGAAPVATAPAPAPAAAPSTAMVVHEPEIVGEWERQLDPRNQAAARMLAKDMFDSRMFTAYGTPQAVLSTIMVGRELGLPAMASLRAIHNIDGRHALGASLMAGVVIKSGLAEYFEPIEISPTTVTFETKRKGARNPMRLTHTIDMARQAWSKTAEAWDKSGWGKNPTDMLVARCQARLARLIYPDLLAGLYTPEELADITQAAA